MDLLKNVFIKKQRIKKTLMIIVLLSLGLYSHAQINNKDQNQIIEPAIGLQIGTFGVWATYKFGLSKSISLHTEIGLEAAYINFGSGFQWPNEYYSFQDKYAFVPVINIEPRWYYHLRKKEKLLKNNYNTGNFITLKVSYSPSLFAIAPTKNPGPINQISLIPKWGIIRPINAHFSYEVGFGIGYRHEFFNQEVYAYQTKTTQHYDLYNQKKRNEIALDLHLRLSYNF